MAERFASPEEQWQAVLERNAAADGLFFYGVRSTGIYCRPTCPSRRPRRENVSFFPTAEAAEQAGFRPCRRCEPQTVSTAQRVVAEAERLLEAAEQAPTLSELGAAVGMSPYHLQRIFKRVTGLSPKQYAAAVAARRLKSELKQSATVSGALYQAGYGSARAVYDKAHQHLGMTPGAYRAGGAGERIAFTCVDTPLGRMLVAATARGVCAVRFGEDVEMLAALRAEFPRAELAADAEAVESVAQAIVAQLEGRSTLGDLPLDVQATAFQHRVWAALRSIPYGEIRSYQEVARMIGEPAAVRAVARACATNPVAVLVPCHRVVRANGELSGYRWGAARKQELLSRERRG